MSWLSDYLEYTKDQEAPEEYHFWVAIGTVASVLGRHVWLDQRSGGVTYYQVFPGQLMIVLTGPSGAMKSSALRIGRRIAKDSGLYTILAKASPERVLKKMADSKATNPFGNSEVVVYAPELTVLFSKATYADSMIDNFTLLADAEESFEYSTNTHGDQVIERPCVTMLAGTTPASLGESIPMKAHHSGFLARFLFVFHIGGNKPINPLSDVEDEDIDPIAIRAKAEMETRLIEGLKDMRKLAGPVKYTRDGRRWYDNWLTKYRRSAEGQGEGYPTKRPDHMRRVAIALRVAGHKDLILDEKSLEAADAALTWIEKDFDKAFSCIGTDPTAKLQQRVVEVLKRAGAITEHPIVTQQLYSGVRRYSRSREEIIGVMTLLVESGVVGTRLTPPYQYWWLIHSE